MKVDPQAITQAIEEALLYRGQTDPNPTVGAVALDSEGKILALAAHQKAGEAHAEVLLIQKLKQEKKLNALHTIFVTLEPCHHYGKTPPCSHAILELKKEAPYFKHLILGEKDPNPKAKGGLEFLVQQDHSLQVQLLQDLPEQREMLSLIQKLNALHAPFKKRVLKKQPWITVKQALTNQGSMIPPSGQKTFTDSEALIFAHGLRKRSRGILTGSGTVLADHPEFTVRKIPDFNGALKEWPRFIAVLDRRKRVPETWVKEREKAGFQVKIFSDLTHGFKSHSDSDLDSSLAGVWSWFYEKNCLEVLVEAGPTLTQSILEQKIWDEHVLITQSPPHSSQKDLIRVIENASCLQELSKA